MRYKDVLPKSIAASDNQVFGSSAEEILQSFPKIYYQKQCLRIIETAIDRNKGPQQLAIRPVLKMGDPRLYEVARPVTEVETSELATLIEDMRDTMRRLDGAGLAAPQIGVGLRVVVFGVQSNPRYPDAETVPETVLVNPEIQVMNGKEESDWEGCLSVPGMRGLVPRPSQIVYRGIDQSGNKIEREATGFHARVVQHECDHLDGILYPMRIKDLRQFGFEEILFPDLKRDTTEQENY